MLQNGFFGFEHSYLSRAGCKMGGVQKRGKSSTGHLQSVANYCSNTNKVAATLAVNLPTDRHELYAVCNRHSATVTRKNGRIAETFIINFDKRMTLEHQKEALGRFLMAVTFDGKIKAEGWIHIDKEHNPNAHVMVIDADEEGNPVGHFSRNASYRREHSPVKGNPTVWLRKTWQDECNIVLEEQGYDFRLDMRSNIDRALAKAELEKAAKLEDIYKELERDEPVDPGVQQTKVQFVQEDIEPTVAPECPPMHVDAPEPDEYADDLSEPEEVMAQPNPKDAVAAASQFYDELRELRHLRSNLEAHTVAVGSASRQLDTANREHHEAYMAKLDAEKSVYSANEQLKEFQRSNGKLKGLSISVKVLGWKLEWQTALRKEAQAAQDRFSSLSHKLEYAVHVERSHDDQVKRWDNAKQTAEVNRSASQHKVDEMLSAYGERTTLESAEQTLNYTAHKYAEGVAVEEVTALYERGEITVSNYRDVLELKGETHLIEELDEAQDAALGIDDQG